MSNAKRTPLYDFNLAHGGRMVDFAGWEMPVQYAGIVEEHKGTRAGAGLFDVSHMGEATVEGPDAERFLNHVLTNDVAQMDDGRVLYSLMCYPHGGVVDDLLVYRRSADRFMLCLNAANTDKDLEWLRQESGAFQVDVADVSQSYGLLALQGPKAMRILQRLTAVDLAGLSYYRFLEGEVAAVDCLISRTGYTGEKGVELFAPWEKTKQLAEALVEAGRADGLVLAGLGARDSLRLEAGYSLYGHEIDETITPPQAGLMWTVSLGKSADFIGKEAIAAEKEAGPEKRIVFFRTGTRRIARPGTAVKCDGREVGAVVSGTFSPILNEAIGSALLEAHHFKQGDLAVDLRGTELPIIRAKPPFLPLNPQG